MRAYFLFATVVAMGVPAVMFAIPGCSSDTPEAVADAGEVTDVAVKPKPQEAAVEETPDTGPAKCPTTTPIAASDVKPQWQPPPGVTSVCTQADLDALKAVYKGATSVTFTQIKTTLGATCSGCVFSPLNGDAGAAPNWSIFVEPTPDGGTAIDNRTASCFAHLGGEPWGAARAAWEGCLRTGCKLADCDNSDTKLKKCKSDVQSGACKTLTTAYVAACPNETALLTTCNLYESIALGCGGGADGGLDASTD
jgi:hypothetical protein